MTNCVWCTKAIGDVDSARTIETVLQFHGLFKSRRRYKLYYHAECIQALREHQERTKAGFPESGKVERI